VGKTESREQGVPRRMSLELVGGRVVEHVSWRRDEPKIDRLFFSSFRGTELASYYLQP